MKLAEVIRRECVRAGGSYEDKAMALCDIASLVKRSDLCRDVSEEAILEALQERETLGSTGIGGGVAIPHCRLPGVQDFVVGAVSIPEGVDFEAADRKKVYLLVFIIAPAGEANKHIRLLSSISRQLDNDEAVKRIVAAQSDEALVTELIEQAGADIPTYQSSRKNLLSVFVQDQKAFGQILGVLAGLDGNSLTVLDAQNSRIFLDRLPPRAGVSAGVAGGQFCRGILAVVERRLTNEMIRRIEGITGSLAECIGVLVTVQELSYCGGSLEA